MKASRHDLILNIGTTLWSGVVLTILLVFPGSAQGVRANISELVQKIAAYNRLDHNHVGWAGGTSDQYYDFIELSYKATTEELLTLLKHENSVVKGYASWALVDRKYPKLSEILLEFLKTGEKAETMRGCYTAMQVLANEFYDRVSYQGNYNELLEGDKLFFASQITQLDYTIAHWSKFEIDKKDCEGLKKSRLSKKEIIKIISYNSTYLLEQALENNRTNLEIKKLIENEIKKRRRMIKEAVEAD